MAGCTCGWKQAIWWTWGIHAIISATYLGLCVTSGNNISRTTITGDNGRLYKSGLMACVVLSFIVVFFFLIASPVIMLGKVFGADLTLSYGMMLGSGWNSAWVVLLSGLVLNAARQLASSVHSSGYWSDSDYSAFQATYAFAYIMCGSFIVLVVIQFFGRHALEGSGSSSGDAYVAGGATGNNTGGGTELPSAKSSQWPPPAAGASSANNAGAWNGWNQGTQV